MALPGKAIHEITRNRNELCSCDSWIAYPSEKARNRYHVSLLTIDSTSRARLFSPACQDLTHRVRALGTSRLRRTIFDKTLRGLRYRSAARFAVAWDRWSS